MDAFGNLYGTSAWGGDTACNGPWGCGTVFKIDISGMETVLHAFAKGTDGYEPLGTLFRAANGILYGTTNQGGALNRGTVLGIEP